MIFFNFLVIGVPKAGTTTVYDILKQHPEIYLGNVKETNFFVNESFYEEGSSFLDKVYPEYKKNLKTGDIDPIYIYSADAMNRIKEFCSDDIKIIVILRNPIDRAYSHYLMDYRNGEIDISFEEAIRNEMEGVNYQKNNLEKTALEYLEYGKYYKYISMYLEKFSKDSFKYYIFETDVLDKRQEMIQDIFKFLDIDSNYVSEIDLNIKSNEAYTPKSIAVNKFILNNKYFYKGIIKRIIFILLPSRKIRRYIIEKILDLNKAKANKNANPSKLDAIFKQNILEEVYLDDIKKLEKLINKDLSVWLK